MAERLFTPDDLKRYNGERGAPAYLAHGGIVYDVSDCPSGGLACTNSFILPALT